jgi:hypothetical protein
MPHRSNLALPRPDYSAGDTEEPLSHGSGMVS